ncbi:hypothetical protein SEA_SANASANA_8 [Microbacterium phage SanaSana]|uniref:hypothetical protein n=1 Tax=Microbacterium phage Stoor TaxID=2829393 RepID=UPI001BF1687E|nr:hypothetical protein QDW21_gp07 [Microbacterium phage Stoor]QUE26047.1 hypothetical protein SEA_STOOR_7 [Microbacterium phage Stoor]
MALKEYEIADPNFGTRTFQWDKDRDGEVGFPKDAKLVKRGDATVDETADGADPDPVANSQEPGNVLEQTATGQANQADVDAAKAKEAEEQKAAEDAKANKAAAAPANK